MITVSNIAQATEVQLICMTYEIFINDLEQALQVDARVRKQKIEKANQTLGVLAENLNFEVEMAQDLFKIYVYIQDILINHWTKNEKLEEVKKLIQLLLEGYEAIKENNDVSQPMMQNTQSIYAGMTYGRGYLEEQTMDDAGRGFKA